MIEGVNSSLQAAQLMRANVHQTAETVAFSADSAPVQKLARAPSMSIYVDIDYDTAVLQFKNAETQDVIDQIPSETLLQTRAQDEARRAAVQEAASQPLSETKKIDTSAAVITTQADALAAKQTMSTTPSAPTQQQIAAFAHAASAATSGTPQGTVSVLA